MRHLILLASLILLFISFFTLDVKKTLAVPNRPPTPGKCLNIGVNFSATNWPSDNKLKISCKGYDRVPGTGNIAWCPGDNAEVSPGESIQLEGCDCEGNPEIQIDESSIPSGCNQTSEIVRGANGETIGQNINVTCPTPPGGGPPGGGPSGPGGPGGPGGGPQPPSGTGNPSSTENPSSSSIPPGATETPNPTENPPGETPTPPGQTPTPTPPGQTPTPPGQTPTPPGKTPTPTPTATPTTPPFSEAMCKCDGIQSTPIFPGQPANITSFGKVEGKDLAAAKITSQGFFVAKNNTVIAQSGPITAQVIENGSSKVRYKSEWKYTFPQDIDKDATYRVWSQIKCEKKTLAYTPSQGTVLGVETLNKSLWQTMLDYFTGLFSPTGQDKTTTPQKANSPTQPPTNIQQLKLGDLKPASVVNPNDTCRFLILQFKQ